VDSFLRWLSFDAQGCDQMALSIFLSSGGLGEGNFSTDGDGKGVVF